MTEEFGLVTVNLFTTRQSLHYVGKMYLKELNQFLQKPIRGVEARANYSLLAVFHFSLYETPCFEEKSSKSSLSLPAFYLQTSSRK